MLNLLCSKHQRNMQTLEIVIGLIFVYLLLSLLASIVQELFSNLTSLRGRLLIKSVAQLLELDDKDAKQALMEKFKNSRVYQKYYNQTLVGSKLPSYLSPSQFLAVVKDLLKSPQPEGEAAEGTVVDRSADSADNSELSSVKDTDLRNSLEMLQYHVNTGGRSLDDSIKAEVDQAEAMVSKYFNEMMDLASAWYRRNVQYILILIGLSIAIAFDADTFEIYKSLGSNSSARQEVLQIATDFVNNDKITVYQVTPTPNDTSDTGSNGNDQATVDRIDSLKTQLTNLIQTEINTPSSPLGLGWSNLPVNGKDWFFKAIGWIITALAISLGAPFWYDLLKMLVSVRGAAGGGQSNNQNNNQNTGK